MRLIWFIEYVSSIVVYLIIIFRNIGVHQFVGVGFKYFCRRGVYTVKRINRSLTFSKEANSKPRHIFLFIIGLSVMILLQKKFSWSNGELTWGLYNLGFPTLIARFWDVVFLWLYHLLRVNHFWCDFEWIKCE